MSRPASVATGVVPSSDDGRNLAVAPARETVTGSTGSATAVVPTPPGDPRRAGGSATAASGSTGARASLGATNGAPRRTTAPVEPEPAPQPAQQQSAPPAALPGATPIRSTGGFSYR
jgi:hypothetical protein